MLISIFTVVTATVTSPGGNGASSSLVVVGVVIGVLVSLVLGVAIVVIVLYFVRHRLTGGKFLTGRRSSEKKLFSVGKYDLLSLRLPNNEKFLRGCD